MKVIVQNTTVKYKTGESPFVIFVCLCWTDQCFCKTSFQEKAKNIFEHNEIKLALVITSYLQKSQSLGLINSMGFDTLVSHQSRKKTFFIKLTSDD